MSIVTYENVDTPVFELDTMRYLFRDGLQGMWIDFLPDYAFANTDLTTPANPGEGIAGYVDRGPYGYNDTQPVITARPIFGRVPVGGRRNLFTNTPALAGAVVGVVGSGGSLPTGWAVPAALGLTVEVVAVNVDPVIGGVRIRVYGEATNDGMFRLQVTNRVGMAQGQQYRGSIYAVKRAGNTCYVANVNLSTDNFYIPLDTDAQLSESRIVLNSATALSALEYRIEIRKNSISSGESYNFTVDIGGSQFEIGPEATPYQRVGNEYDISEAGVPSVYYAHYDGADDVLPSSLTIPSISEGCFILVGTAGIWIDNEWVNTTGTLTVGPTTYTGGPSGILPVVGNILSIIWREEPLTEAEKAEVVRYGVKRGSPGEIE